MAGKKKLEATNNKKKTSQLGKCLKAPLKILSKALDFYVRSITDCSGRARYGPRSVQLQGLPKSLGSSSSRSSTAILYTDEDLRELIRAASIRSLNDKIGKLEVDQHIGVNDNHNNKMPRSFTSTIGRIDEDELCDFGEEVRVDLNIRGFSYYPRSRSQAVSRGRFA